MSAQISGAQAAQPFRNPTGGMIDRSRPIRFTFDGKGLGGYAGDSLASALLANGVRIVGRSFKYHRPRGIFGAGTEEPNALVQLGSGARTLPNSKATEIELYEGLSATSQNCWPSPAFDLGAAASFFAPLLPAGFYYKTFKWPPAFWEKLYEPLIRRAAGLGRAPTEPDPDRYEHRSAHCDVLVVGAGAAGLSAAAAAAEEGARVILTDEGASPGGSLLARRGKVGDETVGDWLARMVARLDAFSDLRRLVRTTAIGYYDHNQLALLEKVADHRAPQPGEPRQRLWHVWARRVVLATGAHERSLIFDNNDRPGVMLASAARLYANRYAVRPGSTAVLFTNNDSAYEAARDLAAAGLRVAAVIDCRESVPAALPTGHRALGHRAHRRLVGGLGHRQTLGEGGRNRAERVQGPPDATPQDRLRSPLRLGRLEPGAASPRADGRKSRLRPVDWRLRARSAAAGRAPRWRRCWKFRSRSRPLLKPRQPVARRPARPSMARLNAPFRHRDLRKPVAQPTGPFAALHLQGRGKRFIDLQEDVTDKDVALAVREGYRSVEHVKRYTTLGMGTDQGKTGNTLGFVEVARALGHDPATGGTTTFRPPYVPVTLGALAGMHGGRHFLPIRRTPMHDWHVRAGAEMVQSGSWLRPQAYPRRGERLEDAAWREASAVRRSVGIVDVSTLGKLELFGSGAAEFLQRVYANGFASLPVGRSSLRAHASRGWHGVRRRHRVEARRASLLHHHHDRPGGAGAPASRALPPGAVARPRCRACRGCRSMGRDCSRGPRVAGGAREGRSTSMSKTRLYPSWLARWAASAASSVRLFRISFSGDLAYEIYVPARRGAEVWQHLLDIGAPHEITPYGLDALNALRIEKGHVTHAEINGRTTAEDLGLGRMLKQKGDFIGKRSLHRQGLTRKDRWQLVGLASADGRTPIPSGAKLDRENRRGYARSDSRGGDLDDHEPDAGASDRARASRGWALPQLARPSSRARRCSASKFPCR